MCLVLSGPKAVAKAFLSHLMDQSYSMREAARIVGINLRTGRRWRNGRHAPSGGRKPLKPLTPVRQEEPASGSSRYLSESERIHLADRLREKATTRQIAAELGRSPSTITREILRNRRPMPRGHFAGVGKLGDILG